MNAFERSRGTEHGMTDNFDYTNYPDESRTYPEVRYTESIKEEYRTQSRKRTIQGILLLFGPMLVFIVPVVLPEEYRSQAFIGSIILVMSLFFAGLFLLIYYGLGMSLTLRGFEILERVGPPSPQIVKRIAFIEINDVHLLTYGISGHLYAVAFRGSPQLQSNSKAKIPSTFFRWEKQIDIEGVKMYRREGTFAVPVSPDETVIGDAVLYGAPFHPSRYQWTVPEFTKEELMNIVESITEDANRLY